MLRFEIVVFNKRKFNTMLILSYSCVMYWNVSVSFHRHLHWN